jgi:hypothetical protein
VRTLKRDYVRVSPKPDAQTVIEQLPGWLAHYNEVHPHRALGYRSPREATAADPRENATTTPSIQEHRPRPQMLDKLQCPIGRLSGDSDPNHVVLLIGTTYVGLCTPLVG